MLTENKKDYSIGESGDDMRGDYERRDICQRNLPHIKDVFNTEKRRLWK